MKAKKIFARIIRVLIFTLAGIVLLAAGALMCLYSPGMQELIRERIVMYVNKQPGTSMTLDRFSLRFPLTLKLDNLCIVQQGDTMVAARSLDADVRLLPLLEGRAELKAAKATGARYTVGTPDSTVYIRIAAGRIDLDPAAVDLANMHIKLSEGHLFDGTVDLTIQPDTVVKPTPPSEPTTMQIKANRLYLHNFTYRMRMVPVIDSLGANITSGSISDIAIDLQRQTINASSFAGNRLNAAYIACDSTTIANTPVTETPTDSVTPPWTIKIADIDFTDSRGLYTTRGIEPQAGLDFAYIEADSMHLHVADFYNQAANILLPITLSGRERCGVDLSAKGTFLIADSLMHFDDFTLRTATGSQLSANGYMGVGDMTTDPALPMGVTAEGDLAIADLKMMFPYLDTYLNAFEPAGRLGLEAKVEGTPAALQIAWLRLIANGIVQLNLKGSVSDVFNPDKFGLDLGIDGRIQQFSSVAKALLPPEMLAQYRIPPMTLDGHVRMSGTNYDGRLEARTGGGLLALGGYLRGSAEAYDADLKLRAFPVNAFAPAMGIGRVTGSLQAEGHGFDLFKPTTSADVSLRIDSAAYGATVYRNITGNVELQQGNAEVDLLSNSPELQVGLTASGNLDGDTYNWTVNLDGENIDLYALEMADDATTIKAKLSAQASYTPKTSTLGIDLQLNDLLYKTTISEIDIDHLNAHLNSNDSVTNASLQNRDAYAYFSSDCGLDSLMAHMSHTGELLSRQMEQRTINVDELQHALPPFVLDVNAGSDNFITDILKDSDMGFRHMTIEAANDSLLTIDSRIMQFKTGQTRIDTITFAANQQADSLMLHGHIGNRPGTLDAWHQVDMTGHISNRDMSVLLSQRNAAGKQGFRIGLDATMATDSTIVARFNPLDPMIGYQQWTVNPDNYISYCFPDKHIDANLHMTGNGSSLDIFTDHVDGHDGQEALNIKIGDIHIQDWIAINPFSPQMSGDLNADMQLAMVEGNLNAKGTVGLQDFYYDRQRVGTIEANVNVTNHPGNVLYADVDLSIDGVRTMTLSGDLNDMTSGSPYNLDFKMIRFPLATVNPFLPADMARLRGSLDGSLDIKGDAEQPVINGTFRFDSAAVKLIMTGVDYRLSDTEIPMVNNHVTFDNFRIYGLNDNPLSINGNVDATTLTSPKYNIKLDATDMMLVNNNRVAKGADVYGKALISLDADVQGNMNYAVIDARLDIRPGTNVTYVMSDAETALQSQSNDEMVRFVNFTDSVAMAEADSISQTDMAMIVNAKLIISEGSTINVDLSANGQNKVSLQPVANLDFTMSPLAGMRLTGRINLPQGFVRYTPPLMSEKLFNFEDNSYIAFNGDVMNPTLNVHAVDVVKANVTQEGQNSRLVNFDVELNVTGNFNNMDVAFDMSTNDDVTVANELESMSPQQRANQAMNLLLYNVYTGPGTKGNASLSGNPLYSFLESQLNSWAANNIRGVDISFGIDQYDKTVNGSSSQTTSYSYQVSKSLFNDRFKIVVGGNYSTDANADENFSENLINDISFEYYLNDRRSMYVRIFRHTGYESIIEGEVTETGVGFVYRRKLNRVGDMFKFLRPKRRKTQPVTETPEVQPSEK